MSMAMQACCRRKLVLQEERADLRTVAVCYAQVVMCGWVCFRDVEDIGHGLVDIAEHLGGGAFVAGCFDGVAA
eukprot:CAMPEP_0197067552 /NCGR_PEP_ID=MMETSP1384-20130603/180908_1 /TAXON_ID=29189 /ORGANISM="Ammonia sp." /LENGTH=72 /DNA_ID=CAMNT_0042505043 /DNA_START=293 /DNA_END=509 /DNA_ORIENTATION=-